MHYEKIWKLPCNCHTNILHMLSSCLPLTDVFCKRFYNFICTCVLCGKTWCFYSRMQSRVRRNVQFLCERYKLCCRDFFEYRRNIHEVINRHYVCSIDPELPLLVQLICEMVMAMVSNGLWCLTDHNFSSNDVAGIIALLCTGQVFYFLCTSCMIFILNKYGHHPHAELYLHAEF